MHNISAGSNARTEDCGEVFGGGDVSFPAMLHPKLCPPVGSEELSSCC